MERSYEYIDFKSYTRYLKKVTGEPADSETLKRKILSKTMEPSEMQTIYLILKRLSFVAAAVLVAALCSALYGYFSSSKVTDRDELWIDARVCEYGRTPVSRLYEAYRNSNEIRDGFL